MLVISINIAILQQDTVNSILRDHSLLYSTPSLSQSLFLSLSPPHTHILIRTNIHLHNLFKGHKPIKALLITSYADKNEAYRFQMQSIYHNERK